MRMRKESRFINPSEEKQLQKELVITLPKERAFRMLSAWGKEGFQRWVRKYERKGWKVITKE